MRERDGGGRGFAAEAHNERRRGLDVEIGQLACFTDSPRGGSASDGGKLFRSKRQGGS